MTAASSKVAIKPLDDRIVVQRFGETAPDVADEGVVLVVRRRDFEIPGRQIGAVGPPWAPVASKTATASPSMSRLVTSCITSRAAALRCSTTARSTSFSRQATSSRSSRSNSHDLHSAIRVPACAGQE